MKPYTTPILTVVFYILGVITLLYGISVAIQTPGMSAKGFSLLSTALVSAIQFGCGQAISFLGRSAHYTEQIALTMGRPQNPRPMANPSPQAMPKPASPRGTNPGPV